MFSGEMTVLVSVEDFCRPLRHKYCSSHTEQFDDDPLGCVQAIGSGLVQNKSLVEIQWKAYDRVDFLRRFWLDFT
jgi:hypothetical protein